MKRLVLCLVGCTPEIDPPTLDAVEPVAAAHGATVRLTGHDLCGGAEGCALLEPTVDFGTARATTITTATDKVYLLEVPIAASVGMTSIVLTFDGRSSNALPFQVL